MQGTREKTEETAYRVLSRHTKHLLDQLPALCARQTLSVQLQAVYVAAAGRRRMLGVRSVDLQERADWVSNLKMSY